MNLNCHALSASWHEANVSSLTRGIPVPNYKSKLKRPGLYKLLLPLPFDMRESGSD